LVVNAGSPENFERWWQALSQAIEKQLEYTQTHLKGPLLSLIDRFLLVSSSLAFSSFLGIGQNFSRTAETLEERKATHTYKSGFVYQGWWSRGNVRFPFSCPLRLIRPHDII